MSAPGDNIEFYDVATDGIVARVDSSMVPRKGEKISIRKQVWVVEYVTFALDHSDNEELRAMRANVNLRRLS